ncbi:MAG TPA: ABC transporter ATP-binding protein [Synergistaceae bacterium]|nr:ABC transporter ATP-binding protein [Synergistaceae bacterium]
MTTTVGQKGVGEGELEVRAKSNRSKGVEIDGVTKIFRDPQSGKDVVGVDDISTTIAPGELVTLLGPSGCGKTTTLRMIAGFELPTQGRILLGGEDITTLPPNHRDTAMVFQSYGLFPHMNVFDNVAYGLKLRKVGREALREKVGRFLRMVGLEELAERPPSRLSGGQQQRVALARALIVEPSVLLLDEPLSNLDALLRESMRVEIRRLQRSLGITAVYVTHDRTEGMSLSDRIVVMHKGRIVQTGTPREIYRDPVNAFVAEFVGKVAFFPAEVRELRRTEGVCAVRVGEVPLAVPRFAPELREGDRALVMCRPESMVLADPGQGVADGVVTTNVYLGNSVESFVRTDRGEVLVQVDNPDARRLYGEGEAVSIGIVPALAKVLPFQEGAGV